jgi:hypothetical protein
MVPPKFQVIIVYSSVAPKSLVVITVVHYVMSSQDTAPIISANLRSSRIKMPDTANRYVHHSVTVSKFAPKFRSSQRRRRGTQWTLLVEPGTSLDPAARMEGQKEPMKPPTDSRPVLRRAQTLPRATRSA